MARVIRDLNLGSESCSLIAGSQARGGRTVIVAGCSAGGRAKGQKAGAAGGRVLRTDVISADLRTRLVAAPGTCSASHAAATARRTPQSKYT